MNKVMKLNEYTEITKGDQFVWDWQYRMLGGFMAKLADCIAHADTSNQKRLVKAFPEEAQAIIDFQSKKGYWTSVERKMEAREAMWTKEREAKQALENL